MTIAGSLKLSATQYLALGEDPPGVRLELINGEIYVSPSPNPAHSHADRHLTRILLNYIMQHDLGELLGDTDTIFDLRNVRRPDLLFIQKSRRNIIGPKSILAVPDLCIEIVSPSSVEIDRTEKFALYEKHGLPHYWLLDPHAKSIEAYKLQGSRLILATSGREADIVHLPPFPDLPIPLAELWRE